MTSIKGDRLQIRVDPAAKRLLERAAEAQQTSVSAFVLRSASDHAVDVLADRRIVDLGPDASASFAEALARPAEVNHRLAGALERPTSIRWLD